MDKAPGILPSVKGGKAGLAEVSINEKDFFPGLGIRGGQVQGRKRLPLPRSCGRQEQDAGRFLRIGQQHKFRIIAEDVKAFFHEGTAIRDDQGQLLPLLSGKQGQLPCQRQVRQAGKVLLVPHLRIQGVPGQQGQKACKSASGHAAHRHQGQSGRYGSIGAKRRFQNAGAWFRRSQGQGVFLPLFQQHQVKLLHDLLLPEKRDQAFILGGHVRQKPVEFIPLLFQFTHPHFQRVAVIGDGTANGFAHLLHILREGGNHGILPSRAGEQLFMLEEIVIEKFDLLGNSRILNAYIGGDHVLLAAPVRQQPGEHLHLDQLRPGGEKFRPYFLHPVERGIQRRIHILDDPAVALVVNHLLVYAAELAAKLANALDDELLRPRGGHLLLPPGMVIVNLNKIIQGVFRLLRMGKPQRQLQQAAFLGIGPRYAQLAQHSVSGLLHGNALHENGPSHAA